jgi:uncharacterized protein (DUF4415 family)
MILSCPISSKLMTKPVPKPTGCCARFKAHFRLDPDVLDWFKAQGAGYQTRINAVLRAFVHAPRRAEPARQKSE